jgi:hypothetical protein
MDGGSWNDSESKSESESESLSYFSHPQIFSTHAIFSVRETSVGNTGSESGESRVFSHLISSLFTSLTKE